MKISLVAIITLSLLVFISCKGSDSSSANNKTNSTTDTTGDIDTNDNSTLSLTKKRTISKKQREKEYGMKIKESELDAKLIKLCDISANLSELKNQVISKSKKRRILRELRYYLLIIEKDLVGHVKYPQVITLLETINQNLKIQNNNLVKLKKKSNTGTKKILKRTNHRSK